MSHILQPPQIRLTLRQSSAGALLLFEESSFSLSLSFFSSLAPGRSTSGLHQPHQPWPGVLKRQLTSWKRAGSWGAYSSFHQTCRSDYRGDAAERPTSTFFVFFFLPPATSVTRVTQDGGGCKHPCRARPVD